MHLPLTLSRRRLMLVSFVALAIFLVLFIHFSSAKPTGQSSSTSAKSAAVFPKQQQASPGLPVRLRIPKINVDAAIESVGLRPNGDMDIPKSPANAAWYNKGPRPGEKGSAVIDGHFGYKDNIPAVFDNLFKLQKGDKLFIEDAQGGANSFVVQASRNYDPNANAKSVFFASDGGTHLNLITCEGVWDATDKSYSNRLVVFTDKQ